MVKVRNFKKPEILKIVNLYRENKENQPFLDIET
jgi:hypothetical protein